MSTRLHDFPNNAVLKLGATLTAGTTGDTAGSSHDFIHGDGNCFAIQVVGEVGGNTPILTGKVQESTDGTTWTDVTGGGFTAAVTDNDLQKISFQRTKRYLRYYSTMTGTGTLAIPLTALIGEQLKQV